MTIWKSHLSDKIKAGISPSFNHVSTIVWLHHLDSYKTLVEKARWELHKNAACYFQQILEAALCKTAVVQLLTYHFANYPRKHK